MSCLPDVNGRVEYVVDHDIHLAVGADVETDVQVALDHAPHLHPHLAPLGDVQANVNARVVRVVL